MEPSMNRKGLAARAALLAVCAALTSHAWADAGDEMSQWIESNAGARKYTPEEAMSMSPPGPNPFVSMRPEGAETHESYWRARNAAMAASRVSSAEVADIRIKAELNNSLVIKDFGTRPGEYNAVDVYGTVVLPPPVEMEANAEDEGSIPLATPSALTPGNAAVFSGTVGDGPFGSASLGTGDFDFYEIPNVTAGQVISIDVDTPEPFGDLDPFVVLWDENGGVVAFNDDDGASFDSFLAVFAPADGNYYVSIAGFGSFAPNNPFDSASGTGAGSEGTYDVTIALNYIGTADLIFNLRKNDIFGASFTGNRALLSLVDDKGRERQGSTQDATGIHPAASPLPGGTAALSHTVDNPGTFSMSMLVLGPGDFTISLRDFKNPLLSGAPGDVQTIFIDFDGAAVDVGKICFGLPPGLFVPTLSPLASFLPNWGLTADDESDVIDAIMSQVHESLVDDVRREGPESRFDIRLLNSRDHADPGDAPNTSRVVVGGTIAETFCPTLGIAESIDVGNFETSESAFVLLDLLSADASNPNSLNQYPISPYSSIIELIGAGVGNITAHEAGHFLGNWHTDQFNENANIQDQGGNLANTIGIGPDGIFGTGDDVDVDFGPDVFVPNEGFRGIQNTGSTISIGNPTPK
jgi:hypothetical protein